MVGRAVDGAAHNLDIEGELALYQRDAPGASFDDPDSFGVGRQIARYDLVLQDILTVIATDTGLPTLLGDMRQTAADTVDGGNGPFGRPGLQLRFFATGLGHRSEATAPAASLSVAGASPTPERRVDGRRAAAVVGVGVKAPGGTDVGRALVVPVRGRRGGPAPSRRGAPAGRAAAGEPGRRLRTPPTT